MLTLATTLIKAVLLYGAFLVLWLLFTRFILKSPFENLPGPPSNSWLFGGHSQLSQTLPQEGDKTFDHLGNVPQLFNVKGWGFHRSILKSYGRVMKISGAFGEELLLTFDPKALHHILVKDQQHYEESATFTSRNKVLFGPGLLSTHGDQHRRQRKILNPVFSIKHMREMIPIFYEVAERLRLVLKKKVKDGPQEVDVLHWITRTALELIGQSGMGYSFDSLADDKDYHPYSRSVKRLSLLLGGPVGFFSNQFIFPWVVKFKFFRLKRFIVEHMPWQRVHDLIDVVDTMYHTSLEIIKNKQQAMESAELDVAADMANKRDIISILMKGNAMALKEDRLSEEEVIGQVSTLVFAAMDTTSSAVSRILELLATHQDVQERLRREIQEAQKDGQLTYDQLVFLPFLDAVCRETLRIYPPINIAPLRIACKDMILPLSKPILDTTGKEVTEIFIRKGTNIVISVLGANCNPDLWGPDAHEWKPDRWLSPLPEAVEQAHMPGVYSHLMTFLGGGRSCIGFKFSQLEMKVVLSVLLASFRLSLSDKVITWQMTGVAGPAVEGPAGVRQQLPLIMSRVD